MIYSMTGYGSASGEQGGKKITIEMKAVNHRYSDITVKLPRAYGFLEDALRRALAEQIERGKVDLYVNVDTAESEAQSVSVNLPLAKGYLEALGILSDSFGLAGDVKAVDLLRLPDVYRIEQPQEDAEAVTAFALSVLAEAIDAFQAMRAAEGERLRADMEAHLNAVEGFVQQIRANLPQIVSAYRSRLEERMREVLGDAAYDETRLLTEVALFSDRVDINEEVVRLESHLAQMRAMLEAGGSVGRKLDFLIQEMNREVNTIGSKSNDAAAAKIVVEMKSEIEKLREQTQNIE